MKILTRAPRVSKHFVIRQKRSRRREVKYSERMCYSYNTISKSKKSKYISFSIATSYNSLMTILYLLLLLI